MSLTLITCVPAITAMRSRTTAPDSTADQAKRKIQTRPRMLESLPDGKEELEMADVLRRARTICRELRKGVIRIAVQYLRRRSGESDIVRGIDAVGEIGADGPHRRAVTNTKTHVMDHIVEIPRIVLVDAKRYGAQAGVDVPHVVEQYALDILAEEGKAQLYIINEESV